MFHNKRIVVSSGITNVLKYVAITLLMNRNAKKIESLYYLFIPFSNKSSSFML
jgi:hypothetical protein